MGSWSSRAWKGLLRGVVRRRKRLAVITTLVALVVLLPGAFFVSTEPQRYRSRARGAPGGAARPRPGLPGHVANASVPRSAGDPDLAEPGRVGGRRLPKASFQELLETSYQTDPWQSRGNAYLGWRGIEVPVPNPTRRALAELQRARVTFHAVAGKERHRDDLGRGLATRCRGRHRRIPTSRH